MSNAFLSPKVFANAGLKLLKNNLVMAKLCDSEGVEKEFKAGVGGTVYVKRPPEFVIRTGRVANAQDVVEGEVAVNVDKQAGVDVQFTSVEETQNLDALLKSKVLDASMSQIASYIDGELIARVNEFHNWVGTPGNTIDSPTDFFKGPQRLDEMAVPMNDRNAIMTPEDGYGMAGNLLASAGMAGNAVAMSALSKAKVPMIGGVDPYITQTIPSLTLGDRSATAAVDGANQNVTYLSVKSTYTQTLNIDAVGNAKSVVAGEVFTLAGVYAVNPRTKAALPYLQQFVVITGGTSPATGTAADQNLALTISPPIITSGAFQNVSAAPADDAVVTWLGTGGTTYRPSAVFHKTAIKLIGAKLIMPYSGEADYATDPETGITVRYWRYSDGANDTHNHRWDVLFGTVNADRRLGTRLSGT
jgi:hypothetical protein